MKRKIQKFAKTMLKKSLTANIIDEKKARVILNQVMLSKPPQLAAILKTYKRLIELAINSQTLIVETAGKLENSKNIEKTLVAKTAATKVIFKINPLLIIGARITHGDWVYDGTLETKLKQLHS